MDADSTYPIGNYLDGVVDTFAVEGKVYGIPTWCLTMWMFYNKKIFDEAGVAYPSSSTSWDDMVDMAIKTTKRDADGRITQFGTNGWDWWTFPVMQVVWSNGGSFFYNADMTKAEVNHPRTVEALQKIADLIHVHKTNPSPLSPPSSPVGLLSDNTAMEANGDYMPWDNKDVFLEKYDYLDATLCPSFNGNRTNIYWPDCFLVNSKSKAKEGAYKWTAWFASDPEATAIQCKVVFPVTKVAYTDPAIANRWLVSPRPPGMIAAAAEHAKNARLYKVELHIGELEGVYYNEISRLWNNEATAQEVCDTMNELMNEIMAKPVEI